MVVKVPRVAVCGVAGYNRGDDAIAMALAQGILAKIGSAQISIAVLAPASFGTQSGVRTFLSARSKPKGLLGLVKEIALSDLVILGGGSLIQDKFGGTRIKGVMGYAWLVSWLAMLMRKPLVTAPLGIDDLHSQNSEAVAAEILGRCRKIAARDNQSLENARRLAAGKGPVRVPDPAFGLESPPSARPDDQPFVLAPAFEGEYDDLVADLFAQVAVRCAEVTDRPIVIVAMDNREEEDAGRIGAIMERLPPDVAGRVSLLVPQDVDAVAGLLRGSAGVVAMRLHAMILAYGFAPISCLSRTTKTDAFMQDYSVPGLSMNVDVNPTAAAALLVDGVLEWHARRDQEQKRVEILRDLDAYYTEVAGEVRSGAG